MRVPLGIENRIQRAKARILEGEAFNPISNQKKRKETIEGSRMFEIIFRGNSRVRGDRVLVLARIPFSVVETWLRSTQHVASSWFAITCSYAKFLRYWKLVFDKMNGH